MSYQVFEGSMVALITPFQEGVSLKPPIDEQALRNLVDWQIDEGTDVLVPCGTTGESATLDYEEHDRVIQIVVEQSKISKKRVLVLAGTGSNSTFEAIEITRRAKKLGADGSLQVTPYYNKPTQEGLFRHFKTIAEAVDTPIILYNVPGRTSVNMLPETVARLAKIPNIVGIKEASGNLGQIRKVIELCGPEFTVLSGEDAQNLQILELGGKGMISVTANVAPRKLADVCKYFKNGSRSEAKVLHEELQPLHDAMFFETNPIPAKTALNLMGKCTPVFRLPLCEMSTPNAERLKNILKDFHLL